MTETSRIEFKRELNEEVDIEKEVIAFLNYKEGGYIYFGIDKYGKTVGISDMDGDMLKIKNRIKDNILPSPMGLFDVVEEDKDGLNIIKIIVASGNEKPYYKKRFGMTPKGSFIRIGTAAEPMTQNMIDNLFSKRTRNSIGKIRSNRQDLYFEQLKIYYEEHRLKLNSRFASNLALQTDEGDYNYVGYLMADNNAISVRVAKYKGTNRVHLIQNNEYGYCSLIKATKQVLDRIDIENKTKTAITYNKRIDKRLWDVIAIKESIINAMIHNDYTSEIAPKIEIFDDRIEITSVGSLPDRMTKSEFFMGLSMPRNPELMRIFKDIELVEHLGSGIPRILEAYSEDCFVFTENFTRLTFPNAWNLSEEEEENEENNGMTPQAPCKYHASTMQVSEIVLNVNGEVDRNGLLQKLGLVNRDHFRRFYLTPAILEGFIEMTIPDKPNSYKQKYRLTEKGKDFRKSFVLEDKSKKPIDLNASDLNVDEGIREQDHHASTTQAPCKYHASTMQVSEIVLNLNGEVDRNGLLQKLGLVNRDHFRRFYLTPAILEGFIEMTIPDKPNSRLQKYRLTDKGKELQKDLANIENLQKQ